MINFKATIIGSITVIVFGLLLQLIILLAATGNTLLTREYPGYEAAGSFLLYALAGIGFFLVLSVGGYITASIAKSKIYLHSILVAVIPIGISIYSSQRDDGLTLESILFLCVGIIFALCGGYLWTKKQKKSIVDD